jgi:hypothetical protein
MEPDWPLKNGHIYTIPSLDRNVIEMLKDIAEGTDRYHHTNGWNLAGWQVVVDESPPIRFYEILAPVG